MAGRRKKNGFTGSAAQEARRVLLEQLAVARKAREEIDNTRRTEALHHFRVSLRRMHTWLRNFAEVLTVTKKQRHRLRKIARATNSARDAQAHLEALEEKASPELSAVRESLKEKERSEMKQLRKHTLKEFDRLEKKLRKRLKRSDGHDDVAFAQALVEKLMSGVSDLEVILRQVLATHDPEKCHNARVRVKELRYLLQPYKRLDPDLGIAVDKLEELQTLLGQLHDLDTFQDELETLKKPDELRVLIDEQRRVILKSLDARHWDQPSLVAQLQTVAHKIQPGSQVA
jgi:CHAD domain-containing protein